MSIQEIFKSIIAKVASVLLPFFLRSASAVVLPIVMETTLAALTNDQAAIAKAKAELNARWKAQIKAELASAKTTPSKIDDVIFEMCDKTELDEALINTLFDQSIKFTQGFFRIA